MPRSIQTLFIMGALVAGASASSACNRSPAAAHDDAVEAQKTADQKAVEAQQEAEKATANATKSAQQAMADARAKAAEAQATANEKIRTANRDIEGEKGTNRDWGQKKLDDVNNMIDEARVKAQKADPKAKANFNTAIADVQAQRDALQAEVASLDAKTGTEVDHSKDDFSKRVDRIKEQIRSMEKSL
jgi:hypothetical protein